MQSLCCCLMLVESMYSSIHVVYNMNDTRSITGKGADWVRLGWKITSEMEYELHILYVTYIQSTVRNQKCSYAYLCLIMLCNIAWLLDPIPYPAYNPVPPSLSLFAQKLKLNTTETPL